MIAHFILDRLPPCSRALAGGRGGGITLGEFTFAQFSARNCVCPDSRLPTRTTPTTTHSIDCELRAASCQRQLQTIARNRSLPRDRSANPSMGANLSRVPGASERK